MGLLWPHASKNMGKGGVYERGASSRAVGHRPKNTNQLKDMGLVSRAVQTKPNTGEKGTSPKCRVVANPRGGGAQVGALIANDKGVVLKAEAGGEIELQRRQEWQLVVFNGRSNGRRQPDEHFHSEDLDSSSWEEDSISSLSKAGPWVDDDFNSIRDGVQNSDGVSRWVDGVLREGQIETRDDGDDDMPVLCNPLAVIVPESSQGGGTAPSRWVMRKVRWGSRYYRMSCNGFEDRMVELLQGN
ncbi:hypothetical protein F0562_002368 [Nyssa sinensis]|uniref:Uncharacterized protein n=1 Tax=Nyssa sinensis TaxID=561372 RepID=A0A5J5C758_9ASTE|nr:hypothetical protein F0562_002368 [Nyssa sinensis]